MIDDVVYPGAKLLFEMIGMGGPMFPVRFYSVGDASSDQAAQFYLEKLPQFEVEIDEWVDGERWLRLDDTEPTLEKLSVKDIAELSQKGKELDGDLVLVEIANSKLDLSHAENEYGFSYIDMAKRGLFARDSKLPADAVIIVLSYFKNPY